MTTFISRRSVASALLTGLGGSAAAVPANAAGLDGFKSFGTAGKEKRVLKDGAEAELLSHTGKGCLTHMWFGGDFHNYGLTRIRVYVDGEQLASIDMELMMGHGIGFQDEGAPWGVERMGKTGQPSGIYNTYRIPFGQSVRVTAQRAKDEPGDPPLWWIIRGVENLTVEVGGIPLAANARLKLHKVVNRTVKPLQELDMCNTSGSGLLYMVTIAARSSNFCFLESCVRAYIDGARQPMLLSSGMEDYFLGTYYFNRGKYYTPVAGLTHLVPDKEVCAYRFHERDPVLFARGLRLTVRAGEELNGKVFGPEAGPKDTEFTTYVWVYEW